jgi:hypothetical protein
LDEAPAARTSFAADRVLMHLLLSIPGLLARDALVDARAAHLTPHLARLIASAGAATKEPDGIGAALAPHYGIARGTDWPLAAIRLAALGVDPDDAYWLVADPVTLVAGHDDVHLAGAVRDLTAEEATVLIATLNAHFAVDEVEFVAPRPDAWFVRAPGTPAIATRPLDAVAGRTLRECLPEGRDAVTWRRWQNEIQMLLHEHPVNLARENAGRAPANSVWFSDGGRRPTRGESLARIRTWANGGIAAALATHVGAPALPPGDELGPVLAVPNDRATLVVALEPALDVAHIDRAWAAPAWSAIARGTLDIVKLITDGAGHAAVWTAQRQSAWQKLRGALARHDLDALLAAARAPTY